MSDTDQLKHIKDKFKEYGQSTSLSRETAPLIYDVGQRALIGAFMGFGVGFVLFKRYSVRKFTTLFGFGCGIGLNYTQLNVLWHAARGTFDAKSNHEQLMLELDELHKSMKMKSKIKRD